MPDNLCPVRLTPGMVVKDKRGVRKVITGIDDTIIHWHYLGPHEDQSEHATPYARFADSHFVTAERAPLPKAA